MMQPRPSTSTSASWCCRARPCGSPFPLQRH
jgi:hypothetical protein